MPIDHAQIHGNGWRQGSVVAVPDSQEILRASPTRPQIPEIELPPETRLVVISHSCDVCSKSPLEVNCEFCPATPLTPDKTLEAFGFGRDPRTLRLPILVDGQEVLHELVAPLRFCAPRGLLERIVPDQRSTISDEGIDILESWLASRVRRRVLPNAFDQRFGSRAHRRIRKAIAPIGPHVRRFLYSLSPDDEITNQAEPYRLRTVVLARSASLLDRQVLEEIETAKDNIEGILNSRAGIEAIVEVAGDEEFTFAQFRTYADWGFEDMSLDGQTEVETAEDEG